MEGKDHHTKRGEECTTIQKVGGRKAEEEGATTHTGRGERFRCGDASLASEETWTDCWNTCRGRVCSVSAWKDAGEGTVDLSEEHEKHSSLEFACLCLLILSILGCRWTIQQVVTELQQEAITLKAHVADQSELAEAVRAINNLATAQVRKDTPRHIDVEGLGRPKEFTVKEEDFLQRPKKTEAFFAGVIKESEMMMLEWSVEHVAEITQEHVEWEFTPRATHVERGVSNLEFVLQQMYTALMALTRYEANDICCQLAEGPVGGMGRNDTTRREEEESETCFPRSFLFQSALCWNSERGLNDRNPTCRTAPKS